MAKLKCKGGKDRLVVRERRGDACWTNRANPRTVATTGSVWLRFNEVDVGVVCGLGLSLSLLLLLLFVPWFEVQFGLVWGFFFYRARVTVVATALHLAIIWFGCMLQRHKQRAHKLQKCNMEINYDTNAQTHTLQT